MTSEYLYPRGKVIVKVTWTLLAYLLLGDSTCVLNLKSDRRRIINCFRLTEGENSTLMSKGCNCIFSDMLCVIWRNHSLELLYKSLLNCCCWTDKHAFCSPHYTLEKNIIMDLVVISSLYTCKIFLSKAMCNSTFGARDSCFLDED